PVPPDGALIFSTDPAPAQLSPLSLHDALPIFEPRLRERARRRIASSPPPPAGEGWVGAADAAAFPAPSDRQMLDRGHAAQPRGQALEQGQAVATHRLIIDVDHHAVEERIDLRTQ